MQLICPACSAVASAEAWANEADIRTVIAEIVKLPAPVAGTILPYLGLFRPERRALTWKKARKVVGDLAVLVESGHVQVQGQVARPCQAKIWAQAIDEMLVIPGIKRPLKNHNYLRQVAWNLADQADAAAERSRETVGANNTPQGGTGKSYSPNHNDPGESEIMRKMREIGRI